MRPKSRQPKIRGLAPPYYFSRWKGSVIFVDVDLGVVEVVAQIHDDPVGGDRGGDQIEHITWGGLPAAPHRRSAGGVFLGPGVGVHVVLPDLVAGGHDDELAADRIGGHHRAHAAVVHQYGDGGVLQARELAVGGVLVHVVGAVAADEQDGVVGGVVMGEVVVGGHRQLGQAGAVRAVGLGQMRPAVGGGTPAPDAPVPVEEDQLVALWKPGQRATALRGGGGGHRGQLNPGAGPLGQPINQVAAHQPEVHLAGGRIDGVVIVGVRYAARG